MLDYFDAEYFVLHTILKNKWKGHSCFNLKKRTCFSLPDNIPIVRTRCIILVATNDTLRPTNTRRPPHIPDFIGPYLCTKIPDTTP